MLQICNTIPSGSKMLEKKGHSFVPHTPRLGAADAAKKNGQHSVPRQPPSEGRLKGIPPRHRGLAGLARLQSPPIPWRTPRCLTDRREASPEAGGY